MWSWVRLDLLDLVDSRLRVQNLGSMNFKELSKGQVDDLKPVGEVIGWVCVFLITHLLLLSERQLALWNRVATYLMIDLVNRWTSSSICSTLTHVWELSGKDVLQVLLVRFGLKRVCIGTAIDKQRSFIGRLLIQGYDLDWDPSKNDSTLCWLYHIRVDSVSPKPSCYNQKLLPSWLEILIFFLVVQVEKCQVDGF